MPWTVIFASKAVKQIKRLSEDVRASLKFLIKDIQESGPVVKQWPNFGKITGKDDCYHCHLKKGRPTCVAVWRDFMDTVELAIQKRLKEIPAKAAGEQWQGETTWSVAVKAAIVGVGRDFGWLTAANGCETDEGKEWLYDVLWYQSDQAKHMTDVPLVAECEWGGEGSIKEDFEKLLVARSKYRVMVFQADSEESVRGLIEKMHLWVSKFHRTNSGDTYLLIGWALDHWIFDLYVY